MQSGVGENPQTNSVGVPLAVIRTVVDSSTPTELGWVVVFPTPHCACGLYGVMQRIALSG
ncbi:MAG: hypothetical protein LBS52_00480 [Dysgonamonadaceae bacterium]|nr:hypothetical protein [Dysgonamonadaceae bacterium]